MRKRRVAVVAVGSAALICAAFLGWAYFEATWIGVTRTVVSSPDVPAGFNGARIVFVADLHAGDLLGEEYLESVVERVESLDPDILILGGDYGGGGEGGSAMFSRVAARFRGRYATVAVLGNHEYGWAIDEARSQFADKDIVLLSNSNVRVRSQSGDSLRLAGLEDFMTGTPDAERAAREVGGGEFAVLVSHNPDALPAAIANTEGAFDLALSGHTHGGQLTLFGLWAPLVPSQYGQRFAGGWTDVDGVPVLVTRGIGTYQIAARFFARPEISVIELRSGPEDVTRVRGL